eukprot:3580607-Pleurochrysis_carterae.AAC.1
MCELAAESEEGKAAASASGRFVTVHEDRGYFPLSWESCGIFTVMTLVSPTQVKGHSHHQTSVIRWLYLKLKCV